MKGKCNCGQIEFEILGTMPGLYQCHCSLCRRQSGTSSNTATIVSEDQFRWLSGEDLITSWVDDSGFRSDFCSRCGSPVPNPVHQTSNYWIPVGLLEDAALAIRAHLFVGSKASWDTIASAGHCYDTMPQLSTLLKVLNGEAPT